MEVVGWLLFELVGTLLFEAIVLSLLEVFCIFGRDDAGDKPPNPFVVAFGFALLGGLGGGLSLVFLKNLYLPTDVLRAVNLIFTPILLGGAMAYWGKIIGRKKEFQFRTVGYWALFTFVFAIVRLVALG